MTDPLIEFSIALSATALVTSCGAILFLVRTVARVQALQDQFARLPVSRIESLATAQAELADTMEALANRVKMQRVRNAANHVPDQAPSSIPDPHRDPDGWRKAMNAKLALARLNGSSQ